MERGTDVESVPEDNTSCHAGFEVQVGVPNPEVVWCGVPLGILTDSLHLS